jgi:trimeric autotransporter adhesin
MKNLAHNLLVILAFFLILNFHSTASAQGTAFTYDGRLQDSGSPANGTYNLQFLLYTSSAGGSAVAGPVTNNAVAVSNGLFTVIIDFGAGVWNGATNWLEIGTESNGVASFTTLAPRQQLTPTPYAIYAENANSLGGTVSASQLTSIGNTNVFASDNFFVGPSGNATTSGYANTAIGVGALVNNTSGFYNTADGYGALQSNTSGFYNTAIGEYTLENNTTGYENTADGVGALYQNTSGILNTASGLLALQLNTVGSHNTAMGVQALFGNLNGSNNLALGYRAGFNIGSDNNNNIEIGNQGQSGDNNLIRIGDGQSKTFIAGVINGDGGGLANLSAAQLTSIGNTNGGSGNFFVGHSGNAANRGYFNTANGYGALTNNIGGPDIPGGSANTADGAFALANNTYGDINTAIGTYALADNTIGSVNTAIGHDALQSNTSGSYNTAIGTYTLENNPNGSYNIALGYQAGEYITTGNNNIEIGNQGQPGDNNIIRIGDGQTATYLSGDVYANGVKLTSDRNAKENFTPVNAQAVLDKVASLPITQWNYKTDKNAEHIGPMAQDFKAAFKLAGPDDKHISVVDEGGVALAAIQGLKQNLDKKDSEIQSLKLQNENLEKRLKNLEILFMAKN